MFFAFLSIFLCYFLLRHLVFQPKFHKNFPGHLEADIGTKMCESWFINKNLQYVNITLTVVLANVCSFEKKFKSQVASSIGIIL